jgi:hypothetical protein
VINISTPREYLATYVTAAQMSQFFIDKVGFISAKAYGAKGDGVTDDTASINAAIATAIANGNSMVYMPCGTYLNSGLSSDSTSITFVGDGSTFTGSTYPILDWAQLVDKGIVGNTSDFNASITNSTTIVSAINEIENELSTHIAHTSRHLTLMSSAGDMIYRKSTGAAILPIGTAYYTLGINSGATAPQWVASLQSLMTAKGDIVYASAANTPAKLAKAANDGAILIQASDIPSWLAKGTAYQHLGMNSGASAPEWQPSANSVLTAAGDTLYASGANTLARLAKGTGYQSLNMNSGATTPEWQASLQSLMTAQCDIVYASAANTPTRLAKGTAGQLLQINSGATAPEWTAISASGSFSDTTTIIGASTYITKTIPLGIAAKRAIVMLYSEITDYTHGMAQIFVTNDPSETQVLSIGHIGGFASSDHNVHYNTGSTLYTAEISEKFFGAVNASSAQSVALSHARINGTNLELSFYSALAKVMEIDNGAWEAWL